MILRYRPNLEVLQSSDLKALTSEFPLLFMVMTVRPIHAESNKISYNILAVQSALPYPSG